LIERYEKEVKAIKDEAFRLAWYMRGSLDLGDSMLLCDQDKQIINKIIENNLEVARKSGLPFF